MGEERERISPGGEDWRLRALAAEKTVEVLKRKVQSLYNEGAQTAIHRQLDRARRREEDNRRRRERIEVRAAELRKYSEHLEVEVARRTRAIQTILDNVTFGFLVIDHELKVQEGFTRSCAELFGRELAAGDDLAALLGIAESVRHSEMLMAIDQVFEDLMPEEVSLDQIPRRFEIGGRVLQVEARVVRGVDEEVAGLLVTISDITALEEAQRQSRHNEVLVGVLRQKSAFEQFVMDTRYRLEIAGESLENQALVRRAVHTVKGNAASYGLAEVVAVAHRVEQEDRIDAQGVARVAEATRGFLRQNSAVLGIDYDDSSQQSFEVPEAQIRRLRALIADEGSSPAMLRWAAELIQRPARDLLGPLATFVEKLAARLEKIVDFELEGAELPVDTEVMSPVFRNLPHLIRNAVDHGIEPPHARGEKPPRGRLKVSIRDQGGAYRVQVQDDGRGIPLDRLAARAVALGIESEDSIAGMDEGDKVALIFRDGLSSVEVSTDISGRGVGMSAVQAAVREQGGRVLVQTRDGGGTTMTLIVPKPALVREAV